MLTDATAWSAPKQEELLLVVLVLCYPSAWDEAVWIGEHGRVSLGMLCHEDHSMAGWDEMTVHYHVLKIKKSVHRLLLLCTLLP